MSEKMYFAKQVTVARDAREAIEYGLMEAGALGTETRDSGDDQIVTGYFDREIDDGKIHAALVAAVRLYEFSPQTVGKVTTYAVPDRDWLAEWKKSWQPATVGRFVIAPPWIESAAAGILIRINPGMAFGTGTHETTRLCLKAIEKQFRGGSFIDIGTGTGILAIAAAKLFPAARIEACDTDADAIEIAKDNARLNDAGQITFRVGSIAEQTASADLVCANLTAPVILKLLPLLLAARCGRLVLSGILDTQVDSIESRLHELGADVLETDQDGEWVAMIV